MLTPHKRHANRTALYAAVTLTSLCVSSAILAQETTSKPKVDGDAVRAAIEANWYINFKAAEACPQVFQLHIALAPGGKVQDVSLVGEESSEPACRALVGAATRAILLASPLPVPEDLKALNVNFDIPRMTKKTSQ